MSSLRSPPWHGLYESIRFVFMPYLVTLCTRLNRYHFHACICSSTIDEKSEGVLFTEHVVNNVVLIMHLRPFPKVHFAKSPWPRILSL